MGSLAGCSMLGGGSRSLHFITDQSAPEMQELMDQAFQDWESSYDEDVEAEFEYMGFSEVPQTMNQQLSAGDPPDMALQRVTEITQYGAEGHLSDLSEVADDMDIEIPEYLNISFDGDRIVIPHYQDHVSRFYRVDKYEEAGVEPADSWPDQDAQVLQTLDEELQTQGSMRAKLVVANPEGEPTQWFADTHMFNNGVDYIQRDGDDINVTIDQEPIAGKAAETLEYLNNIYQYSVPSQSHSWGDMVNSYVNESVATVNYVGGRLLGAIHENNPDIAEYTKPAAPPRSPANVNGSEDYRIRSATQGFCIPEEAEGADLAKDFLTFFMNSDYYTESLLTVPLHKIPFDMDVLDSDAFQSNELVQAHQDYVDHIKEYQQYQTPGGAFATDPPTPQFNSLTVGSNIIPTMIGSVLLQDTDPSEAVATAGQALRDEL